MRILVAHQDPRTRGRLIRAARGFRSSDVEVIATPQEALRRVRDWQPDVVMMSAAMAERYGAQTAPQEADAPADSLDRSLGGDAADPSSSRRRNPRWDRDHAAHELAGILLAIEEDSLGAQQSRPSRDARRPAPPASPGGVLSGLERDILAAVAAGSTMTDLAAAYGVAENVIDAHVADVLAKLHRLEEVS